jgi:hypothetical protein
MRSRYALIFASLVSVAGCVPAWVNPTRDDAATLTFASEPIGIVHVHVFASGRDCQNETRVTGFNGLKEKTEIRIAPGEEIAPSIEIQGGQWTCSLIASFVPKARAAYVAQITRSGERCKLAIGRYEGGVLVPEQTTRPRKWTGSRCD